MLAHLHEVASKADFNTYVRRQLRVQLQLLERVIDAVRELESLRHLYLRGHATAQGL